MNGRQADIASRLAARGAYTLLELVVSMVGSVILVGGLSSSIYIAGQSMNASGTVERASADQILDKFVADVEYAFAFSERSANAVTFTVPDRDGDGQPETIRYAWSGLAGDPLTYEYNGAAETIAEDVQNFNLAAATRQIEATVIPPAEGGGNSLLFVSGQNFSGDGGLSSLSTAEQDRAAVIENWGYTVTTISQHASQVDFDAQLSAASVVYVSGECNGNTINTKLNAATIGVVTESYLHAQYLGFYSSLFQLSQNNTTIAITNTSHYITNGFSSGTLGVATSALSMKWTSSPYAVDATPLANVSAVQNYPNMLTLDAGDQLADSSLAAGRRCQLPWGEGGFNVNALNADGLTIMQRSIEWAAIIPDPSP